MLGKLLKYEIKATARMFLPLYLTILAFAAINRFLLPIYQMNENISALYNFAISISMIIYVTLIVGLVLMTLIVMIQRFYKNLLGDEGYLMFTLPVSSSHHIISKLTVSMLWTVVSGIVAFLSIVIISSRSMFTPEVYEALSTVIEQFSSYFGKLSFLVSLEAVILGLLSVAATILTVYTAIALGHLFNKYKLVISFAMYIVLKTVSQVLMWLFALIFTNDALINVESVFGPSPEQINNFLLISILYFGVITAGYFVLTNYILKRKLNLE